MYLGAIFWLKLGMVPQAYCTRLNLARYGTPGSTFSFFLDHYTQSLITCTFYIYSRFKSQLSRKPVFISGVKEVGRRNVEFSHLRGPVAAS